jgi:hypothetical protein
MEICCENCKKDIGYDKAKKKANYSHETMKQRIEEGKSFFCDRYCIVAYRKKMGIFKKMSVQGRSARSQAVARSNREKPRAQGKRWARKKQG